MKKLITGLLLTVALTATSQTTINLSGMTGHVVLGQNCSNSQPQEVFITTGDLNLNGKKLTIRNVSLHVNGNINGGGKIEGCGNSTICRTGAIQNNPIFDDVEIVNCVVLSLPEFNFEQYGKKYIVLDITGRVLLKGVTDEKTYSNLPSGQILILKVDGFETKKLIKTE